MVISGAEDVSEAHAFMSRFLGPLGVSPIRLIMSSLSGRLVVADSSPHVVGAFHAAIFTNGCFFRRAAAWSSSFMLQFSRCARSQHKITITD
jgi:hypothetical protein